MSSEPMPEPLSRELQKMVSDAGHGNNRRIGTSLLLAVLIGLLLWQTQWPAIRPGLIVLLAGQVALAGFLFIWNRPLTAPGQLPEWLDREASGLRYSGWLENGSRLLGSFLLGIGFWRSTGNLSLAIALGLVYPAVAYWGLTRVTNRQAARRLSSGRHSLQDPEA